MNQDAPFLGQRRRRRLLPLYDQPSAQPNGGIPLPPLDSRRTERATTSELSFRKTETRRRRVCCWRRIVLHSGTRCLLFRGAVLIWLTLTWIDYSYYNNLVEDWEEPTTPDFQTGSGIAKAIQYHELRFANLSSLWTDNLSRSPPWAVFYNVYIPPNQGKKGVDNALRIIKEQVHQINLSYAARRHLSDQSRDANANGTFHVHRRSHNQTQLPTTDSGKKLRFFYNTIGLDDVLRSDNGTVQTMQNLCRPDLDCIHMQHYPSAFEEVTLVRVG
jgi:hypothetical protein